MGSKGSNTTTSNTTSSTAPTGEAATAYSNVLNLAQNVAKTPYQGYTGELTAGINNQQQTGINNINSAAGYAQPYVTGALGQLQSASQPITSEDIARYANPYTQSVVNATQAQFNNQNQQQAQGVTGNAISQGALGGNRVGVAQANLANQQQLAQAPVIANLMNQGYSQGVATALSQQQAGMSGANAIGNLGIAGQNAALTGANQQVNAGTLQQTTQQAADTAAYDQYKTAQAYPYQQAQWLAGMDTSIGNAMGSSTSGTGTTTTPTNTWSQALGAVTSGTGILGSTGAFGSAGWLAALSDERAKENIESVGKTHDGQIIYKFNYKGHPQTHIGLLAQEVEKKNPDAVQEKNGLKYVDYDAATADSVERSFGGVVGYASGGSPNGVAGTPWADAKGWIPTMNPTGGGLRGGQTNAPQLHNNQSDLNKSVASVGDLAKTLKNSFDGNSAQYGDSVAGAIGPTSVGGAPLQGVNNNDFYGGGSKAAGDAYGGNAAQPLPGLDVLDYGQMARGGIVSRRSDRADAIHDAILNRGMYADGGVVGFADGGSPSFDDRFDAAFSKSEGLVPKEPIKEEEPYRLAGPAAMDAWRGSYDNDAVKADAGVDAKPAVVASSSPSRGVAAPEVATSARSFAGDPDASSDLPSEVALGYSAGDRSSNGIAPREVRDANNPNKLDFGADNKLWPSLISAGFGMMASRSPNLGVAIGEGGQAGIQSYNLQKKAELDAKKHAQQLEMERQKFERPYTEMTAAQKATMEHQKRQDDRSQAALERPYTEMTVAEKARMAHQERQDTRTEAAEKRKFAQPYIIGKNLYGQDIYARNLPGGGFEVIKVPEEGANAGNGATSTPQAPAEPKYNIPGPQSEAPTVENPAAVKAKQQQEDAGLPANAQFVSEPPPPSANPEVLDTLRSQGKQGEDIANQVKAIAEGRKKFLPEHFPMNRYIMNKVREYDPHVDETTFTRRQRALNEFTVGAAAKNITSMNTLAEHAAQLKTMTEKLDMGRFTNFNEAYAYLTKRGYTSKEVQDLLGAVALKADAVAEEAAKVFAGGGSTALADREHWRKELDPTNPASVMKAKLKSLVGLVEGRLTAITHQYNEGMRTDHKPSDLLPRSTREVFSNLKGEKKEEAPAIPSVDKREVNKVYTTPKGDMKWTGTGWVKP